VTPLAKLRLLRLHVRRKLPAPNQSDSSDQTKMWWGDAVLERKRQRRTHSADTAISLRVYLLTKCFRSFHNSGSQCDSFLRGSVPIFKMSCPEPGQSFSLRTNLLLALCAIVVFPPRQPAPDGHRVPRPPRNSTQGWKECCLPPCNRADFGLYEGTLREWPISHRYRSRK
jgi:hypothetical protein